MLRLRSLLFIFQCDDMKTLTTQAYALHHTHVAWMSNFSYRLSASRNKYTFFEKFQYEPKKSDGEPNPVAAAAAKWLKCNPGCNMAGTRVGRNGLDVELSGGELLGDRLSDFVYSDLMSIGFDARILSMVNKDVDIELLLMLRRRWSGCCFCCCCCGIWCLFDCCCWCGEPSVAVSWWFVDEIESLLSPLPSRSRKWFCKRWPK